MEYDTLRERLFDAEASLKLHVQLAAELAERVRQLESGSSSSSSSSQCGSVLHDSTSSSHEQPLEERATASSYDALLRLIDGRSTRSVKRAVLNAWRSHCDKALMLRNMRGLLPSTAAARMFPRLQDPEPRRQAPPPAPSPPPAPPATAPKPATELADALFGKGIGVPASQEAAKPGPSEQPPKAASHVARLRWRLAYLLVQRRRRPPTVVIEQARVPVMKVTNPWDDADGGSQGARGGGPTAPSQTLSGASPTGGRAAVAETAQPQQQRPQQRLQGQDQQQPLEKRLLSWLSPSDVTADATSASSVRLQHLATENKFLRERVAMVEAQMQPLLRELSEKRELLHQAYVLCHRALGHDVTPGSASAERVAAWAHTGAPGGHGANGDGAQVRRTSKEGGTSEVADAMEAVLEETLRLNRQLEAKMAKMRGAEPKGPSRRLVGGVVSE